MRHFIECLGEIEDDVSLGTSMNVEVQVGYEFKKLTIM